MTSILTSIQNTLPSKTPLHQWEMGAYKVTLFNMGYFALDGGAMFGVVPKTIWNRLMSADDLNRIRLATNCLLIESDSEKIMVDAGIGTKFSEKYQEIYVIESHETAFQTPIDQALASVGLKSGDITQVLFTHLHFDHAGGATRPLRVKNKSSQNNVDSPAPENYFSGSQSDPSESAPTFENARYVIHEGEWNYAICPHERCKASYLKENLEPVLKSGQLRLLKEPLTEILPGLRMQVTGGHTPYHQIVLLDAPINNSEPESNSREPGGIVFWGDLIPTYHHVKIPYVMSYDERPVETMAVKRELLKLTVAENRIHVFEHDPDMPACRLKASEKPDTYAAQ